MHRNLTQKYHFLHRKLTRLMLHRSLKKLLFPMLETGHFHVAKVGSIQHANQQPGLKLLPIAAIGPPSTLGSAITGVLASSSESSIELNTGELPTRYCYRTVHSRCLLEIEVVQTPRSQIIASNNCGAGRHSHRRRLCITPTSLPDPRPLNAYTGEASASPCDQ